jgi:hypothetical protein
MMKILLFQDETLTLNLNGLCDGLNRITDDDFYLAIGRTAVSLKPRPIKHPVSHRAAASTNLGEEIRGADLAVIITKTPYENNYFYEADGNLAILSFYAWEQLTNLPMENGVVFFLASILRFELPLPDSPELTTGCVNDFLWDKTAVDLAMRSGGLCPTCKQHLKKQKLRPSVLVILRAIEAMVELLGSASRANENVLSYLTFTESLSAQSSADRFDVFLCHNSKDKPAVRKVARSLEARKIRPWLDEEQLRPGLAWQVALEDQIAHMAGDGGTIIFDRVCAAEMPCHSNHTSRGRKCSRTADFLAPDDVG